MSTDGGSTLHGYVTDVAYLRHFCPELSPALLRAVCALNGVTPPPDDDFDYLELGCGHGDSTATLAAAYPGSRFWGVDLLPEHIATARDLAARGELTNVRFLERDFVDLAREPLPPFDYVTAYGVLSWIPAEVRAALFAYAARALKPGGVLFVSYNAQPGWAALAPLRRLLVANAPGPDEADTGTRAAAGLAAARAYVEADAGYFTQHRTAREMLDTMARAGTAYMAHEYFHDQWHPLDFGDLATELAAVDLHYVGQLPLHRNVTELALPPAIAELASARAGRDPFALERAKDYVANTFFRNDVFVKGAPDRREETPLAYVQTARFGTLLPAARVARDRAAGLRTLKIEGPLFPPLLARVAEEDAALLDLAGEPALAAFSSDEVRAALVQLVLTDAAVPFAAREPAAARHITAPTTASLLTATLPSAFNRAALATALEQSTAATLASPRAGTGVELSLLDAVALTVHLHVPAQERPAWLADFVARRRPRLWDHDRPIDLPAEQARFLEEQVERFVAHDLPKLVSLEIVDPGGLPA